MPDLPGGSSAAPTMYHTMWLTTGTRWLDTTTTRMPLSRVKVSGLKTPAGPASPAVAVRSWPAHAVPSLHAAMPRQAMAAAIIVQIRGVVPIAIFISMVSTRRRQRPGTVIPWGAPTKSQACDRCPRPASVPAGALSRHLRWMVGLSSPVTGWPCSMASRMRSASFAGSTTGSSSAPRQKSRRSVNFLSPVATSEDSLLTRARMSGVRFEGTGLAQQDLQALARAARRRLQDGIAASGAEHGALGLKTRRAFLGARRARARRAQTVVRGHAERRLREDRELVGRRLLVAKDLADRIAASQPDRKESRDHEQARPAHCPLSVISLVPSLSLRLSRRANKDSRTSMAAPTVMLVSAALKAGQ